MKFKAGDRIRIPVSITPGAFLSERFITLESVTGPISGFVNSEEIFDEKRNSGYIAGIVQEVKDKSVIVRIRGSFFVTAGLAEVPLGSNISAFNPI
ncbi:MAG: hypothetical protein HY423_12795 [Candidatus Lambdaproteobacteria bacterium]|nr:hypothetical protein [Candidatus Lambdaproteobacteria bacterium]